MKTINTAEELEIQSPCTALVLRQWLTKAASLVRPSPVTKETKTFLKRAEKSAYEGNVLWEFTPTRFLILVSLLRKSRGVSTYAGIWLYLMVLSMPDEAAKNIQVDLEKGTFTGLPGLVKMFKKGMGKCTNISSTCASTASRASMPKRKKKRTKG